jgi:hypothetical protein
MKNSVSAKTVTNWLVVGLLLALLLTACGESGAGAGTEQPTIGPTYTAPPYEEDKATLPSFGWAGSGGDATEESGQDVEGSGEVISFEGEGFEIKLPDTFTSPGNAIILDEPIANNEGENISLMVMRSQTASIGEKTIEEIVESSSADLIAGGYENLEQAAMANEDFDMMVVSVSADETITGADEVLIIVDYLAKDGDVLWQLLFTVPESLADAWLPVFEEAALSFELTN